MTEHEGMLAPYRVLDLTDEHGLLCGKVLGDLGADVIIVEPPRGSPARGIGPFYHDQPDPERSLYWFAFNTSKRGITLDIESADGRELFRRLVATADVVVEAFPPGHMEGLGLGYEALKQINPGIIVTSITPYGPSGPFRDYKESDLVLMSLGGLTFISGEPDRPPLRITYPQAYLHSGAYAAVGTMMALFHRGMSGEGQHVDVSMQECCEWASYFTPEWWDMAQTNMMRAGMWRVFGPAGKMRMVYPCQDGYVSCWMLLSFAASRGQYRLVEWMDREGMCPDWLRGLDFRAMDASNVEQGLLDDMGEAFTRFFLTKTKQELFDWARANELFLAPFSTAKDLWQNPQLAERGFWMEVEHPELGTAVTYPGPFLRSSEASPTVQRRAPLIGEHNIDIYCGELGLSAQALTTLRGVGVI